MMRSEFEEAKRDYAWALALLGALLSAPAIINLIQNVANIRLHWAFADIFEFYRALFAPLAEILQWPFRWLLDLLRVEWVIPQWFKDIQVLSIVSAGVYLRSPAVTPRQFFDEIPGWLDPLDGLFREAANALLLPSERAANKARAANLRAINNVGAANDVLAADDVIVEHVLPHSPGDWRDWYDAANGKTAAPSRGRFGSFVIKRILSPVWSVWRTAWFGFSGLWIASLGVEATRDLSNPHILRMPSQQRLRSGRWRDLVRATVATAVAVVVFYVSNGVALRLELG